MRSLRALGLLALLLALTLASVGVAHAGGIDAAKRAGEVGERFDGYLAAVKSNPSAATKKLVAEINAKRRQQYAAIGAKNGLPVQEVAKLSGAKLIERAATGDYVMRSSGSWSRK